jgi:hypothetical protein
MSYNGGMDAVDVPPPVPVPSGAVVMGEPAARAA